jgi:hypothetical protein
LGTCWGSTDYIGSVGARALAAALDTNRTLQILDLYEDDRDVVIADINNLVADLSSRQQARSE